MAQSVKDTLLHQYKNGGRPSDKRLPPTTSTFKMRLRHTSEGVDYNFFSHAEDHFKDTIDQLKKLCVADPDKASDFAKKICTRLESWHKQAERFIDGKEG